MRCLLISSHPIRRDHADIIRVFNRQCICPSVRVWGAVPGASFHPPAEFALQPYYSLISRVCVRLMRQVKEILITIHDTIEQYCLLPRGCLTSATRLFAEIASD